MKPILLYLLALCISLPASSASTIEPYSQKQEEAELQSLLNKYEWLYDILMPINYKDDYWKKRSKKSFRVHLRDSVKQFPHPDELRKMERASKQNRFLITGKITYVGFIAKRYRYEVRVLENNDLEFTVRVHFKKATAAQIQNLKRNFTLAQNKWNRGRFDFGVPYQFKFEVVTDRKKAHFSVRLKKGTRGPHDSKGSSRLRV